MMKQYKEFSFSELFYKYALNTDQTYIPRELINRTKTSKQHPFELLLDIYKLRDLILYRNHENSKDTYKTFLDIKELENDAIDSFELEYCLLDKNSNRENYLNECINILRKKHSSFKYNNQYFLERVIENSIINLALKICSRYASQITTLNYSFYKHLSTGSPRMKTFKLLIPIDSRLFQNSFDQNIKGKFVESYVTAGAFYNLFNGSEPINKINWIGYKNTLCYLIKQLTSKKRKNIFEKNKLSHWDITASFFTVQDMNLSSKNLLNQPAPKSNENLKRLNNFVSIFH